MPELPEVETTRRGISPHLTARSITAVLVREHRLRWPVPADLPVLLAGQPVLSVQRRAKYLLIAFPHGHLIIHLGMSGSLRLVSADAAAEKHAHVDFQLDDGMALRYNDPRRFGCILWHTGDPQSHSLLSALGPEPLSDEFHGSWLKALSKNKKVAVKQFIMDSKVVVGVGNIYANEALFKAGIDPRRAAGRISAQRYELLAEAIREVLGAAIAQGGTTLRDFVNPQNKPGYFSQSLQVYGRAGQSCRHCARPLRGMMLGQRATVFCDHCQV